MSQYEVIALRCRETRSREHAAKADDISVRIAHLKLADFYRDQIAKLVGMTRPFKI